MDRFFTTIKIIGALLMMWPAFPVFSQTASLVSQSGFDSENAILDTSVPFAIGAREARQSLRGSFGWPTFQEGLVGGVYFRFDPDGYARFSPSPRLDTDVFEVICRPRTYTCEGRKDGLVVLLTGRGQLQLKVENVMIGDTFHVSEGVAEIELPERVLQPLDLRLENLLMAGGEFVVRRGGENFSSHSLVGLFPVSTYLRWIAARQDYTMMPRGWPVPNSQSADNKGGLTQSVTWASPMPQPQVVGLVPGAPLAGDQFAVALVNSAAQADINAMAAIKSELGELRALFVNQNSVEPTQSSLVPSLASADLTLEERMSRVEILVEQLLAVQPVVAGRHENPAEQRQSFEAWVEKRPSTRPKGELQMLSALDIDAFQIDRFTGLKQLFGQQFGLSEDTAALLASVLMTNSDQATENHLGRQVETPLNPEFPTERQILASESRHTGFSIDGVLNGLLQTDESPQVRVEVAPSLRMMAPQNPAATAMDFLPLEEYLLFLIGTS